MLRDDSVGSTDRRRWRKICHNNWLQRHQKAQQQHLLHVYQLNNEPQKQLQLQATGNCQPRDVQCTLTHVLHRPLRPLWFIHPLSTDRTGYSQVCHPSGRPFIGDDNTTSWSFMKVTASVITPPLAGERCLFDANKRTTHQVTAAKLIWVHDSSAEVIFFFTPPHNGRYF